MNETKPIPMAQLKGETGAVKEHIWSLPIEEAFLERLLRDLFENHYDKLIFGPLIQGAAYEMKAPGPPKSVTMMDGYMTIHWGGRGHFHLCIGTNHGSKSNPNPPELIAERRPSRAEFYRGLDKSGHPVTWGFRMFNGAGAPQITIFFPNPFLSEDDQIAEAPDWKRLSLWEETLLAYAGHEADGLDRQGKGFRHG